MIFVFNFYLCEEIGYKWFVVFCNAKCTADGFETKKYLFKAMKKVFLMAVFVLLAIAASAQTSAQKKRIEELRKFSSHTQEVINEMSESQQTNQFFHADANSNESAVGIVNYHYDYYPAAVIAGPDAGLFLRLKRTLTVFPADVDEVLYNLDGSPAFMYRKECSYHDEGCHTDTRIYWNADGKTICYVSREDVNADGKKKPVKLSKTDIEDITSGLGKYTEGLLKKCSVFLDTDPNADIEE